MTMTRLNAFAALLVGVALSAFCGAANAQTMRPEVGKPLQRAVAAMRAGNYAAANAAVNEASRARGLTGEESFVIQEMRGSIAEGSKNLPLASKIFADMLASGRVPAAEQVKLYAAEASMSYQMRNYAAVPGWVQKYSAGGGRDPAILDLRIQSYYDGKDYKNAALAEAANVRAITAARRVPTETQLQILVNSQRELGDKAGFHATMVQLVTYYPKALYWENLVGSVQTTPGYSTRLDLDVYRFKLAQGTLAKPTDLMEMTELALQVPLPGEAKTIVDGAFASGALGTGPEAARQQRLRDLVNKTYESEQKTLPGREAEAQGSHDGNLAASLGEEYASYGQFDKAIGLMQLAMKKDQLRHPEDTKLHLGLIYMRAGHKPQAIATFRTVGGKEGAAEIARLWILQLSHG